MKRLLVGAIGSDGTTDSVNVTFHASPNGDVNRFDFGSCEYPVGSQTKGNR